MLDFEKMENEFYLARYGVKDTTYGNLNNEVNKIQEMWNKIKEHPEVLKWAIQIKRNKWNDGDIINGLSISDAILIDYKNIDQTAYNELIKSIYENTDVARIRLNGMLCTGGCSFLLMSLWNHDLKLNETQKSFAVSEAMAENVQVHFYGEFDIRYQILRNPNWTLEEKQKLIMDFYDDEEYDDVIEKWEWDIVNDNENYKGEPFPPFDRYELFNEWSYEMLLEYYGSKETADRIWDEMEFCKQMHKLRPQQWELQFTHQKRLSN